MQILGIFRSVVTRAQWLTVVSYPMFLTASCRSLPRLCVASSKSLNLKLLVLAVFLSLAMCMKLGIKWCPSDYRRATTASMKVNCISYFCTIGTLQELVVEDSLSDKQSLCANAEGIWSIDTNTKRFCLMHVKLGINCFSRQCALHAERDCATTFPGSNLLDYMPDQNDSKLVIGFLLLPCSAIHNRLVIIYPVAVPTVRRLLADVSHCSIPMVLKRDKLVFVMNAWPWGQSLHHWVERRTR